MIAHLEHSPLCLYWERHWLPLLSLLSSIPNTDRRWIRLERELERERQRETERERERETQNARLHICPINREAIESRALLNHQERETRHTTAGLLNESLVRRTHHKHQHSALRTANAPARHRGTELSSGSLGPSEVQYRRFEMTGWCRLFNQPTSLKKKLYADRPKSIPASYK